MLLALGLGLLMAQGDRGLPDSPDFSEASVLACVSGQRDAWNKWSRSGKGLEDRALRLPMMEARELVGKALGSYLAFLDRRQAYGEAVAAFIEKRRAPSSAAPLVSQDAVCLDELAQLGANLSALQTKLDDLRDAPQWLTIRRAVGADRETILQLERTLRSQYGPQDLSIVGSQKPVSMPAGAYRQAEQKLIEDLRLLWTHYYQALADAIEARPGGAPPLIAIPPSAAKDVPATPPIAGIKEQNPLVGVWTYTAGSQKFNGVAEPHSVLLELWMENGTLQGRYRSVLPDFTGDRKIDLHLHANAIAGHGPQTMAFQSTVPEASGEIVLEGPTEGGTELMLVRNVAAQGPIPRGRELLHRQ